MVTVFGDAPAGAFAEYAIVPARRLAPKPANLSFEEAAATSWAVTPLQALRDVGGLQPGQKVLINGASGGVGSWAIQIAKALGANVTAICSGRNAEMVRSLGADDVIDYTKEDFAAGGAPLR
jgi:NADPH:quinone reductase-like Zn-dependent oxidoreductase